MSYKGKKLPVEEIGSILLKKARILWLTNEECKITDLYVTDKEYKITDLYVAEFIDEDSNYFYEASHPNHRKHFAGSVKATLIWFWFKFFVEYDYVNDDLKRDIWNNQFMKIKEIHKYYASAINFIRN